MQHLSGVLERTLGMGFWIMLGCSAAAAALGLLFPKVERSAAPAGAVGSSEVM
jgi:hypothetical protein